MGKLKAEHIVWDYENDKAEFVVNDEFDTPIDLVRGEFHLWTCTGDCYDRISYKDFPIIMGYNEMNFEQCAEFVQQQMNAIDKSILSKK